MRKVVWALFAAGYFWVLASNASYSNGVQHTEPVVPKTFAIEQPITAVIFYSNWCGACLLLEPRIAVAKQAVAERSVDFVKFDFTFSLLRGKALEELAVAKNLLPVYLKNQGKTGFILLVDPKTQQVLDIITVRDSANDIVRKLEQQLNRGIASASDSN